MKRIAVFGNAGAGKSHLARELAAITGLRLHVIDMMQFRAGGEAVPHEEFSPPMPRSCVRTTGSSTVSGASRPHGSASSAPIR